jgi:hypothetical protein
MPYEGRDWFLEVEDEPRGINAVIFGEPGESPRRTKRYDDYGPPWGFASVGDFYGQNRPGFRER